MSLRRVRKRDGREVSFDKSLIERAVVAAQTAVGQDDPVFAAEVATLVELALRRRYAWRGAPAAQGAGTASFAEGDEELETTGVESIPDIEEIQDLVEVGLIELGHARVAKAYILFRDRRGRARESADSSSENPAQEGRLRNLRVREAEGSFPWSKGRIIAALVQEADLSRPQAEEVATRVEARVIASGLRRISTALIREFVDNELVAMNLSGALARQAPVALPRHDLREVLDFGVRRLLPERPRATTPAAADPGVVEALGGEVLLRYVLADLFEERIVEQHLAGAFQIEDLRAPHLYLTQSIPCDLLARGAPGTRAAFDLLDEVAGAFGSVSRGIVLESPAAVLQPLARASRGGDALGSWLHSLGALARAAGRRVDLAGLGARSPALTARLVEELDEGLALDASKGLPRLFLDRNEFAALLLHAPDGRPAAERLLARGHLVPTWSREGEQFIGPASRRRAREQGALACGGAVALNFARLGQQAGPWREDLVLHGLAQLVEEAIDALAQLARFQRSVGAARSGEARGRVSYALTPVGLREALRALGDGEVRAEQGARLLGLFSEAARRFSSDRGLAVTLTPFFGEYAAARFARLDAGQVQQRQGLLFESVGAAVPSRVDAYSRGYAIGGRPGERAGVAEASLLATVPAGAWDPLELDGGGAGAAPTPQVDAWERHLRERDVIRGPEASADAQPSSSLFQLDSSPPCSPRAS